MIRIVLLYQEGLSALVNKNDKDDKDSSSEEDSY